MADCYGADCLCNVCAAHLAHWQDCVQYGMNLLVCLNRSLKILPARPTTGAMLLDGGPGGGVKLEEDDSSNEAHIWFIVMLC